MEVMDRRADVSIDYINNRFIMDFAQSIQQNTICKILACNYRLNYQKENHKYSIYQKQKLQEVKKYNFW